MTHEVKPHYQEIWEKYHIYLRGERVSKPLIIARGPLSMRSASPLPVTVTVTVT